jgi:hypothetical protein
VNAPRQEPPQRPNTTHTLFPSPRPAAAGASPVSVRPGTFDERNDDDHAPEEPGYGHGV